MCVRHGTRPSGSGICPGLAPLLARDFVPTIDEMPRALFCHPLRRSPHHIVFSLHIVREHVRFQDARRLVPLRDIGTAIAEILPVLRLHVGSSRGYFMQVSCSDMVVQAAPVQHFL